VSTITFASATGNSGARTLHHWVAGAHHRGSGDRFSDVTNPATGEVTARLALASVADVEAAVTVAKAAFPRWRDTSLARRTEVVFRFRELLNARAAELAELITFEHGKVLSEARGEVARGQEVVEFACDIQCQIQGGSTGNASTRVDVSSLRRPLGPVAIISPFNLPAMVPMWFLPIAIAAGNTVVLKPSEKVPSAALWLARLWADAGLPEGVFNVLHGDKVAVKRLLTHPDIKAVTAASFTASRTRSRAA
jgi:malonate-semialdehyde dehydrogenase (acetylating)/methylmalonate-semialdehyde dehydrogenase